MKTILKKKSIFIAILTIILAIILFVVLSSGKKDSKENFSYSKIEKTDIRNIISSIIIVACVVLAILLEKARL